MLALPVLIFLGLDPVLANGTNRVAIALQCVAAVGAFRRHALSDVGSSLRLASLTLPGAVIGAWSAVQIPGVWFQRILAVVIVLGVLGMLLPIEREDVGTTLTPTRIGPMAALLMFGTGFYGGFIQAGVGVILMLVLHRALALNLVHVNVHKVFIVGLYTLPALAVFAWLGQVAWGVGLTLAVGNSLGALAGTRLTVHGGERLIRATVGVVLLAMAVKLVVGR